MGHVQELQEHMGLFLGFLAQKLAKKPLTIVGDGNQKRDFTYVSDVVDSFVKVAKRKILVAKFIMSVAAKQLALIE